MARRVRGDRELRGMFVAECDHFAERFADRGLDLPELRQALVDGSPVAVSARFIFSALHHADHPGWRDFTYMKVRDAAFVLTERDELVPAEEYGMPVVDERAARDEHMGRYKARIGDAS